VRGQFVVTLDVTDIKTCWTEQRACLNKAQKHVFAEVKEIRARLPFKLFIGRTVFSNSQVFASTLPIRAELKLWGKN